MRRFLIIGAGILVACIAFVALTVGGAFLLTQGVAEAGDTFMTALQEDRMEDAYALFTEALQNEVDLETFSSTFAEPNFESWSFNSRSVENNQGQLSGTATVDGDSFNVELEFVKVDDDWLLIAFDFSPTS